MEILEGQETVYKCQIHVFIVMDVEKLDFVHQLVPNLQCGEELN